MENNHIDSFFKNHAETFNEYPSDALWSRITAGLDTELPEKKTRFIFTKWFGFIITIVLGLLVVILSKQDKPVNDILPQQEKTTTIPELLPEKIQDTLKPVIARPGAKRVAPMVKTLPVIITSSTVMTDTVKPAIRILSTNANTATKTVKPIKMNVQEGVKRTVITIREKISQKQFDSITALSMEKYSNKPGMQLIVKGLQGQVHRHTFPAPVETTYLKFKPIPAKQTVSGTAHGVVTWALKEKSDSLPAKSIRINATKDSLPMQPLMIDTKTGKGQ